VKYLLFALITLFVQPSPAAERPNILYILADDLGYGDVRVFNQDRGKIATPNLDRLAAEGMTFSDAHSGSSVCTPTRYGLLTGRYAWRTPLVSGVLGGFSPPLIAENRLTVAALLKSQGYHTACIGKWHLGLEWAEWTDPAERKGRAQWPFDFAKPFKRGPLACGFDTFFGISASLDMPPYTYLEQDRVSALPTAIKKWVREGPAAPDFEAMDVLPALTRRTVETIGSRAADAKAGKPFFIYVPLASPHTPILPTPEWQGKSGLNAYADFVMQTDACVGEMLDALLENGLSNDTLVIFTSDNGCSPEADFNELEKQGHFPSGKLRGMKSDIWEGGHRVPFLVRWPGKVAAGTTSDTVICLTDFMATAAAMTGAELPDDAAEDSFSFLPDLLGTGKSARPNIVHHSIHGQFAVREGDWLLTFCPGSGGWSKPGDAEARKQGLPAVQLHHLAPDPAQETNLADSNPEAVERLTALMERLASSGRSSPGAPQKNDTAVDFRKPRPKPAR
jgi:arylsulfatase A